MQYSVEKDKSTPTVHSKPYFVCTPYTVQCMYTVHCTVYVHRTLYSVCTSVHCTVYVHLYTVQCMYICTLHSVCTSVDCTVYVHLYNMQTEILLFKVLRTGANLRKMWLNVYYCTVYTAHCTMYK